MILKNKRYIKKFIFVLISILAGFFLVTTAAGFAYFSVNPIQIYDPEKQSDGSIVESEETSEAAEKRERLTDNILTPPVRTNFMLVGVDNNESLTDTIIVGSYVSTTSEINLLSIPRDTLVVLEDEKLQKLREVNRSAPATMKINAVNVYGGKKYGLEFLEAELEELLGINIDYYVLVNLDAFDKIVDSVGGIYFDVPEGGLYYSDPAQDLYINIAGGYQLLDGEDAEGLVRFRKGYASQDIQRMKVQQEFMKEFVKQVINKETIKSNLLPLLSDFIKYVKTDFGIEDLPKYIKCISSITGQNMKSETLPGYPDMINGASYYIHDSAETYDIVQKFFYGEAEETTESTTQEVSDDTPADEND